MWGGGDPFWFYGRSAEERARIIGYVLARKEEESSLLSVSPMQVTDLLIVLGTVLAKKRPTNPLQAELDALLEDL